MSRTLHLTCEQCQKTLWVGQRSPSRGWYVYNTVENSDALDAFVREHIGHRVVFQDSEMVSLDAEDVTDYGEDT